MCTILCVVYLLYYHVCCVPVVLSCVLCTCCTIICVVYLLYYHLCCVPVVLWFVVWQIIVQHVHNTNNGTTGTQHKWWYNRYKTNIKVQQVHNTHDSTTGTQHKPFVLCTCWTIIFVVYLLYYNVCCVPVVLSFVLCTCCTIICVVYLLYYHLCCVLVVLLFVLCTCCTIMCVVYLFTNNGTTGTQHKWWYNRYKTNIKVQQVHNTHDSTTGTQHKQ
jgi:hypothetical protein